MPFAVFTKIREVSSEDDQHLAENLIKPQQGKKWKTKNVGEKSSYVVLEMQEEALITGIDIGNEHSAFVEVLVGKLTCTPNDFTEILITCSFMTPIESKSSNNTNRVRCFNKDALVPTVLEKKWSLIKIICTQPFNKHVQYGLSFIKVHVAPSRTTQAAVARILSPQIPLPSKPNAFSENQNKPTVFHIGKFRLREDSLDSESDGASSSLFSRWKKSKDTTGEPTTAATIRTVSNNIVSRTSRGAVEESNANRGNENKIEILDRNRNVLLFGEDEDTVESEREIRLGKQIEADKERRRLEIQKQAGNKVKETRKSIDNKQLSKINEQTTMENNASHLKSHEKKKTSSTNSIAEVVTDSSKKRVSSPNVQTIKKAKGSVVNFRPFNNLLRGVVLVISGIQNPDRGDLRNKALALGAKYKGDWDNTCTHLICAFKNTPKYNQVRGKGKIVTRAWIEKCYNSKKYLPWRRFALDSQELTKPESDEEILDESLHTHNTDNGISIPSSSIISSNICIDLPSTSRRDSKDRNDTLALYELDVLPSETVKRKRLDPSSSDSDTDDEIQRIERKNATNADEDKRQSHGEKYRHCEIKTFKGPTSSGDIYEASTDEEDYLQNKKKQAHIDLP